MHDRGRHWFIEDIPVSIIYAETGVKDVKPLNSCFFFYGYYNLNTTGTKYFTRTGEPLLLPGIHFGMLLTMRSASWSREGSADFIVLTPDMLPSFSTTNCTVTRPCIPFSFATAG